MARLVGEQVVAEALLLDARHREIQPLQPGHEGVADLVDVGAVVRPAVLVDGLSQELDLLVAPALQPLHQVSHGPSSARAAYHSRARGRPVGAGAASVAGERSGR
jgi:hypothetical protein